MFDPRFSKIKLDPRFKPVPRKARKIKIDGRFSRMFTDKSFKTKYVVDKRGRRVNQTSDDDLRRFYAMADEEGKDSESEQFEKAETLKRKRAISDRKGDASRSTIVKKKQRKQRQARSRETDAMEERAGITAEGQKRDTARSVDYSADQEAQVGSDSDEDSGPSEADYVDFARGEGLMSSSSDEEDVGQPLEDKDEIVHNWGELDHNVPVADDASCRLAVCNMDWDRVTAFDILVLFNSFKPTGGVVKTVKIYLSEFGAQRLANEDVAGPAELVEGNDHSAEGSGYSVEKLRQYELNRLKYYYAVVECDSPVTASSIYNVCDGLELELSASKLDLRFVPDDMEFDQEPTSVAMDVPANYKAPEFQTSALQQSQVKLTWDETNVARMKTTMRRLSEPEINELDLTGLLASADEDEDEDGNEEVENAVEEATNEADAASSTVSARENRAEKYKALVESQSNELDSLQELEIMWEPGLKENVSGKTSRDQPGISNTLTPWEQYLNKRKEKRKERKQKHKNVSAQNEKPVSSLKSSTGGFDDPFFTGQPDSQFTTLPGGKTKKGQSKKVKSRLTEEEQRQQEELELLVTNGDGSKAHFSLKGILAQEKNSKKKKKKGKQADVKQQRMDEFEIDLDDPRFEAMFTTNEYAVDPSNPHFKKTKAMKAIVEAKQRKRGVSISHELTPESTTSVVSGDSRKMPTTDRKLSSLAQAVKRKTQHFHASKRRKFDNQERSVGVVYQQECTRL